MKATSDRQSLAPCSLHTRSTASRDSKLTTASWTTLLQGPGAGEPCRRYARPSTGGRMTCTNCGTENKPGRQVLREVRRGPLDGVARLWRCERSDGDRLLRRMRDPPLRPSDSTGREGGPGRRAPARFRALHGPGRLHGRFGIAGRGRRPRAPLELLRHRPDGGRALRGNDREVHRRRRDGCLGNADHARGRRGARRAIRARTRRCDPRRSAREAGVDGLAARAGVATGETAVTLDAEGQGMVAGDIVNTALPRAVGRPAWGVSS